MKRDLYAEVSQRIVSELERGAPPWVKPWSATPGQNVPQNAVTNRPYSGCNVVLLWLARSRGWATPRFLTFKQAIEAGGNVRKGEHGTKVFFVKQLQIKDSTSEESGTRLVPMLREYTVFNVDQCDNLPERIRAGKPMRVRNPDARDKLADDFLCATGANIREGHGEAYYVPGHDYISMPVFEAFKGADHFYNVAFHELTHWTGHRSRLDRDLRKRFDLRAYAAEELVAELGAAFLSAEFGFDGDVRNAGYIASWIDLLKSDKRLTLPILPVLQKTLDASPCGDLTFLVNDLGRAFTDAGIGNKMRDWCDQAGLSHCTAHGLRKAGATIAANNGATAHQLKAIFGWDSLKQAEIYTREADQRRLAEDAMPLLDKVRNESSSK